MKKIYSIFILFLFFQNAQAQFAVNAYYLNNIINMSPSTSVANGGGMEIFFGGKQKKLGIGLAVSRSDYGTANVPIEINSYGNVMSTNMKVHNNFTNIGLYSRYKLINSGSFITPFAEGKIGWGFLSTRMEMEESRDMGNCEPVQPNTVHQDGSWIGYAGLGLDIKLTGIFRKEKEERNIKTYLTIAAGYNAGGKISYFNAEHVDNSCGTTDSQVDYNAQFVNTTTQELHYHTIGSLQTSHLSMTELKVGFGFRF
jgi:hypothetical protein